MNLYELTLVSSYVCDSGRWSTLQDSFYNTKPAAYPQAHKHPVTHTHTHRHSRTPDYYQLIGRARPFDAFRLFGCCDCVCQNLFWCASSASHPGGQFAPFTVAKLQSKPAGQATQTTHRPTGQSDGERIGARIGEQIWHQRLELFPKHMHDAGCLRYRLTPGTV